MKKNKGKHLSGKSFYAALALSLAMVGGACYFAYTQTKSDELTEFIDEARKAAVTTKAEREAGRIVTNITKPVTTTVTTTLVTTTTAQVQTTAEKDTAADAVQEEKAAASDSTLIMPLKGEIINPFSGGELVRSETTGAWQTHNGIDIGADMGDSVCACGSGSVSAVDSDPLWGTAVTIDHGNGIVTRYCGLNPELKVQAGQEVSRGEEIGTVGNTADIESSQQSHIHIEVMKNGSYTDPQELFE